MREIKFRGMTVNGEWVYGLLAHAPGRFHPLEGWYISNRAGKPYAYKIRPETIGQFTGLKDKNKKEIYIGDILQINNDNYDTKDDLLYVGRIEVCPIRETLGFTFRPIFPLPEEWGYDSTSMWHVGYGDTTEIIGNIHENPELLEAK